MKLFIMLLLSAVAFGVTGMGVILLMFTLSYVAVGRDSEASRDGFGDFGIGGKPDIRILGCQLGHRNSAFSQIFDIFRIKLACRD